MDWHILHRLTHLRAKRISTFTFIIFWTFVFVFLCWKDRHDFSAEINVLANMTTVTAYAFLVYVNIVYLVPYFLNEQRFWDYVLLLLLLVILVTPIKIYLLILVFHERPQEYHQLVENWSLLLLLDFLVVIGSTIYSIISDWLVKRIEVSELQQSQVESELNFLKSQINPHFMFNTLNSLYGLSLKKSDKTPEMILRLSEILRYMLYDCNENEVPLVKEIKYLENYIELEKMRYGETVQVSLDKRGKVEVPKIAPLILNGFVENAFKHGVSKMGDQGFVNIVIDVEEDGKLNFVVENNRASAPSVTEKVEEVSGGIGLQNVQRRLDILYPNIHDLIIEETENLYRVQLSINL